MEEVTAERKKLLQYVHTNKATANANLKTREHRKKVIAENRKTCPDCEAAQQNGLGTVCMLCVQKQRTKIANTHCMNCCRWCSLCDKKGHQAYHEDGSAWCFKLMECAVCGDKGHTEKVCRRHWCQVCRTDGLGDNWVGHATERCYKRHKCEVCEEVGHLESRCPKNACDECGSQGHRTEQCERDVLCPRCNRYGHSESRCHQCIKCGFGQPKGKPHRCRRNYNGECRECGGKGVGRCDCLDFVSRVYVPRPPRRDYD